MIVIDEHSYSTNMIEEYLGYFLFCKMHVTSGSAKLPRNILEIVSYILHSNIYIRLRYHCLSLENLLKKQNRKGNDILISGCHIHLLNELSTKWGEFIEHTVQINVRGNIVTEITIS